MGAPTVEVCGNLKFDMTPSPALMDRGQRWRQISDRPLVLAASTREGEESGLLRAWLDQNGSEAPVARLLLVPRHPQRFNEVADLILAQGWRLSRRSQWPSDMPDTLALEADVWLGDTVGEMPSYYASARVALLGGSFAPLGGQNLIEAAACGCPIVMGPSTFNFADAALLAEEAGAAFRVANWGEGVQLALGFCHVKEDASRSVKARVFAQAHRGAASRMAQYIWGITSP
jgi:3-deoxy-D-manno-octulosonic-acid transferase